MRTVYLCSADVRRECDRCRDSTFRSVQNMLELFAVFEKVDVCRRLMFVCERWIVAFVECRCLLSLWEVDVCWVCGRSMFVEFVKGRCLLSLWEHKPVKVVTYSCMTNCEPFSPDLGAARPWGLLGPPYECPEAVSSLDLLTFFMSTQFPPQPWWLSFLVLVLK